MNHGARFLERASFLLIMAEDFISVWNRPALRAAGTL
jgi:hypothetical protein